MEALSTVTLRLARDASAAASRASAGVDSDHCHWQWQARLYLTDSDGCASASEAQLHWQAHTRASGGVTEAESRDGHGASRASSAHPAASLSATTVQPAVWHASLVQAPPCSATPPQKRKGHAKRRFEARSRGLVLVDKTRRCQPPH
eukprot:1437734-Rhodomonas_salina.2